MAPGDSVTINQFDQANGVATAVAGPYSAALTQQYNVVLPVPGLASASSSAAGAPT